MPRPGPARYDTRQLGLDLDIEELDRRVDLRVTRMFEQGLVDEVRRLEKEGLRIGRTASRALGYQQVLDQLDADEDMAAAAAQTAQATRRFVRRQRSWFRRDQRVHWLDAAGEDLVAAALGA